MHNSFNITEEERRRILGIHENATKNSYLKIITEAAEDPRVATAEEIKNDAKGDFSACTCVTKMGWKRGIDTGNNVYYLNPNNNLGYFPASDPIKGCRIYKNPPDYNDFVKNFNCKQRPFAKQATSVSDLYKGASTLQKGDKNNLVSIINNGLINAGKLSAEKKDSDVFDEKTKQAVILFQKENVDEKGNKLRPDGVIGKNTYWAMNEKNIIPSGVSDIAIQKSSERLFGNEMEKLKQSSPLFNQAGQDQLKSNAEKLAQFKSGNFGQNNKGEENKINLNLNNSSWEMPEF